MIKVHSESRMILLCKGRHVRKRAVILSLVFSQLFLPFWAHAQETPFPWPETSGPTNWTENPIKPEIAGVVKYDTPEYAPAPVSVRLQTATGTLLRETWTGRVGEFSFPNIACGDYVVAVDAPGYRQVRLPVEHSYIPLEFLQIHLVRINGESSIVAGGSTGISPANVPGKARKEYVRGLQELSRKNPEQSIGHLRKAVEIYPNYESAYLHLGWVYLQQRKLPQAQDALERVLRANPASAVAHGLLGGVRRQQNELPKAVEELERSLSLEEPSWQAHLELGEIQLKLGNVEQAYPHILRAHQLEPALASIHLKLYNTLILRNNYAAAAAELDEFLQLFPQHPLAAHVRRQREALRAKLEQVRR